MRRKRKYVANTFLRRHDAEEWARDVERSIDRGIPVKASPSPRATADLFRPHHPAHRRYDRSRETYSGRSKAAVLEALKVSLGRVKIQDLTRERLIEFGKEESQARRVDRLCAIDFSFIRTNFFPRCGSSRDRGVRGKRAASAYCSQTSRPHRKWQRTRSPANAR